MIVNAAFEYGETVYLKTDPEQRARIITGHIIRKESIIYYVSCGVDETTHYEIELTKDEDTLTKLK
ncbi:MAG: hypothetical protein JWR05_3473 [Mucilaginibacter sp.]|nr:hypothetical protein [Mucilaginibacter sp.]